MEKYKRHPVDSLCRTCLETIAEPQNKHHLFLTPDLAKKLIVCTSLTIEANDCFSKNLCDACFHKVDELHQFQQKCLDSVKKYQEFLDCEISSNIKGKFEEIRLVPKEEVNFEEGTAKMEPCNLREDEEMSKVRRRTSTKSNRNNEFSPNQHQQNLILKRENDGNEYSSVEDKDNSGKECSSADNENDETFDPEIRKKVAIRSCRKKTDYNCRKRSQKKHISMSRECKKSKESMVYKCDACPKRFFVEHRLVAHKRTHEGLMPYPCSYSNCDKAFNRWHCFSEHIKQHEGTNRWYTCGEEGCGKVYKHKPTLAMHLRKFHQKGPELKSHVCEICGKVFKAMRILQAHKFIHKDKSEFPFVCPEEGCDRRFAGREKLKIHLMRHAGIKNYVCPYCGMRKTTRNELKIHINYHTLERTWPCRFCAHVCNSAGNLKMHVRTVHERAKDYACRFCEKTFAKPDTRKYHEMTHTGEKPNECEQCGKRFIQPAALRTHRKIHLKHKLKTEGNATQLAVTHEMQEQEISLKETLEHNMHNRSANNL